MSALRMSLSQRERARPGTIARQTGYMAECELCGEPYRHMRGDGSRHICGRCGTINLAENIEKKYVDDAPKHPGA